MTVSKNTAINRRYFLVPGFIRSLYTKASRIINF
jgi:hypothetical protein